VLTFTRSMYVIPYMKQIRISTFVLAEILPACLVDNLGAVLIG